LAANENMDDTNGFADFDGGNFDAAPSDGGLKLTARHLLCLVTDTLTVPVPTSPSDSDPSLHCDVHLPETL
jgi:hypothetical protein